MGPRIQADERGITLNKSLAWSMLGTIIVASIWVGSQVQGTKSAIENTNKELNSLAITQTDRHAEAVIVRRETEARLRILENSRVADASELNALRRDMQEMKALLRVIDQRLQERP